MADPKTPRETLKAAEGIARMRREYELLRAQESDPRRVPVPYSAGARIMPLIDEDN